MSNRRGILKSREQTFCGTNVQVFTPLPSIHAQNRERINTGNRQHFGERADAPATSHLDSARQRIASHIRQEEPVDRIARNLQPPPPKIPRKQAPTTRNNLQNNNIPFQSREQTPNPNKRRHDEVIPEKRPRGRPRLNENSLSTSSATNFDRMRPNSPSRYQQHAQNTGRSVAPVVQSTMTSRSQSRVPEKRAPSRVPEKRAPSRGPENRAPSRGPPQPRAPSRGREKRAPSRGPPQPRAPSRGPSQQRAPSRASSQQRVPSSRRSESSVKILDDHEMGGEEQPPPQQRIFASNPPSTAEEEYRAFSIDPRRPCIALLTSNLYNPERNRNMLYAPNIFSHHFVIGNVNGIFFIGQTMEALRAYNDGQTGSP